MNIFKQIKHHYRMLTSPSYKLMFAAKQGIDEAREELKQRANNS